MHGASFAKQCTFASLVDLARFVLKGDGTTITNQQVIDAGALLAQCIIEAGAPSTYIK